MGPSFLFCEQAEFSLQNKQQKRKLRRPCAGGEGSSPPPPRVPRLRGCPCLLPGPTLAGGEAWPLGAHAGRRGSWPLGAQPAPPQGRGGRPARRGPRGQPGPGRVRPVPRSAAGVWAYPRPGSWPEAAPGASRDCSHGVGALGVCPCAPRAGPWPRPGPLWPLGRGPRLGPACAPRRTPSLPSRLCHTAP